MTPTDGPPRPREIGPEENDPSTRPTGADCGTDDVVLGGRVDLNPAGRALLLQALPPGGGQPPSQAPGGSSRIFTPYSARSSAMSSAVRDVPVCPTALK